MPAALAPPACAIVIPVFNQARFLAEAIESCLAQTVPAGEIVVVDDGSGDDAAGIAARYGAIVFRRQSNRGPAAARNAGLAATRAPCVAFLDADDRLLPCALEKGLAALLARPDAVLAYGAFRLIDREGMALTDSLLTGLTTSAYRQLLCGGNFIGMLGAVLFRRAPLAAAGGFDERLRLCEDYELYLRLAREGDFTVHEALVAEYRQHGAGASADRFPLLDAALEVLETQRALRPDLAPFIAHGRAWWRSHYAHEIAVRALRGIARKGSTAKSLELLGRAFALAPWNLSARLAADAVRRMGRRQARG
jgi:glycosyltransferase involved in cell wall biosynthesis